MLERALVPGIVDVDVCTRRLCAWATPGSKRSQQYLSGLCALPAWQGLNESFDQSKMKLGYLAGASSGAACVFSEEALVLAYLDTGV